MPIANTKAWNHYVKVNKSDYGATCVNSARRSMDLLNEESGEFDCHDIICRPNKQEGLSGGQADCVAAMISKCHSRGEEFRKLWNKDNQINDEGDKGNEGDGVLNRVVMEIEN